jgi:hypothetical protein
MRCGGFCQLPKWHFLLPGAGLRSLVSTQFFAAARRLKVGRSFTACTGVS